MGVRIPPCKPNQRCSSRFRCEVSGEHPGRVEVDADHAKQSGITIEDTPENNAVIERNNAMIAEAQAEYDISLGKVRLAR
jgi:hypothetical protein